MNGPKFPKVPLVILEGNQAAYKIVLKWRSNASCHFHRTHRMICDWLYEIINHEGIITKSVNTKFQLADALAKAFMKLDDRHGLLKFRQLHRRRSAESGNVAGRNRRKLRKLKKAEEVRNSGGRKESLHQPSNGNTSPSASTLATPSGHQVFACVQGTASTIESGICTFAMRIEKPELQLQKMKATDGVFLREQHCGFVDHASQASFRDIHSANKIMHQVHPLSTLLRPSDLPKEVLPPSAKQAGAATGAAKAVVALAAARPSAGDRSGGGAGSWGPNPQGGHARMVARPED